MVIRARRTRDAKKVVIKVLIDRNSEAQARQNREQVFLTALNNTGMLLPGFYAQIFDVSLTGFPGTVSPLLEYIPMKGALVLEDTGGEVLLHFSICISIGHRAITNKL